MGELGGSAWLALVIAGLWLAIAAALLVLALRRMREASAIVDAATSMAALLDVAPARPLLVRADGSLDVDQRLLRELGIERSATRWSDLGGGQRGLVDDDLAALKSAVTASALSGTSIQRQVRAAGSDRVFDVRGGPAPAHEAAGTTLLWFSDTSASEAERSKLALRIRQTEAALDSLTHLIEAAPFPMWYRGPDLRLGLVNRAFVEAVEARDASDVISRSTELIDASGKDSARASAEAAVETGKLHARTQPATIRGERRMMRIVNVPLPTGAVAGFAIDIQELEDARAELSRHVQSQRDLSDRMTAGTVQFDADRNVSFFNQPFAVMAQLDPEWLSEGPEFDRVLERMRERNRLPEVRDFPVWKAEKREWFTSPQEVIEEDWILADGDHLRMVVQ
ncbi:MAG TPA: histidine kinase, partial [Sphingomicrobium sp.]